ncbi:hypothetical protein ASPBRDRAFT_46576 [Aspergillus brasiliensis CBS 101740]|uniref:Uncharacterized protein n=1 Tax=Aspergillus brasiliensis (strain CBS 101740 / IMI 381727 / IBT 21946) TaxID=767769 RepID=A0A1L9U9K8_ASPBC|nr:hypothetical protein ASPBRDRAFT_46576 [Aspergillus brasiliensis CBS 101740]
MVHLHPLRVASVQPAKLGSVIGRLPLMLPSSIHRHPPKKDGYFVLQTPDWQTAASVSLPSNPSPVTCIFLLPPCPVSRKL